MLKKQHLKGVLNYDALLLPPIFLISFCCLFFFFKKKISPPNCPSGESNIFSWPFDSFHCFNQSWKRTIWPSCGCQRCAILRLGILTDQKLIISSSLSASKHGVFHVILVKWLSQPVELARYYILTIKALKLGQELLYFLCRVAKLLCRRRLKNLQTVLEHGHQLILGQQPRTEPVTRNVMQLESQYT